MREYARNDIPPYYSDDVVSNYLYSESNRLIINEREFFDQSEILLNTYLKDSQAHIEKYEEEISNAEKQLHDD